MQKSEHLIIRKAILDKAESIIEKDGILSLKIVEITKSLNISTTLFYSLFKNKEDIFVALACRAFDQTLSMRWWINLDEYTGLEKFIAYILDEMQFTEKHSIQSSISTISCNKLIFGRACPVNLRQLNHLAMEYWETPIQLLTQAREQQEIEANDIQIKQFCHIICTYLRGRELIDNTYAGKEYSDDVRFDNARLLTQLLKDICPKQCLCSKKITRAQQLRRELAHYREKQEES